MKLLEYEAKNILKAHGIPVPKGLVITSSSNLTAPIVLKSQVPTGGRGKLGGIKIINEQKDIPHAIKSLLSLSIKGYLPKVLLSEEVLAIKKEYYLSLLIDRATSTIRLIAHIQGGIEVEANNLQDFYNKEIDENNVAIRARELAEYLNDDEKQLYDLLKNLFNALKGEDAALIEINPLVVTKTGTLICGDAKIELDNAAAFRHPTWNFEESTTDTNFVTLNKNGQIATIANGAGLAMATVDAVAANGMIPANFLDIGGGATAESVLAAFKKIQEFPDIQAIVINIFAGITRCDQIALAVIEAKQQLPSLPPLFIRLAGTNFEEAVALLTEQNIPTLGTLEDCLAAAKEVTHG